MMYGLTLIQPWAAAIAHGGKRIENRVWKSDRAIGQRIAIHAGLRFDEADEWSILRLLDRESLVDAHVHGAIVAVAQVDDFVTNPFDVTADQRPWFCGPVGWVLSNVRALPEPVPCRGAQGLWPVPADVAARVMERVQKGGRG
ncbi:MAG TPA: hypothetical protein VGM37_01305 [Armatimonadota bacterium]|jgi:hypothetical protein